MIMIEAGRQIYVERSIPSDNLILNHSIRNHKLFLKMSGSQCELNKRSCLVAGLDPHKEPLAIHKGAQLMNLVFSRRVSLV